MRTTIDIPDRLRAELLALAAKKGLRGYSEIVKEAIEMYIHYIKKSEINKRRVLKLEGVWKDEDVNKIAEAVESAWAGWKTR